MKLKVKAVHPAAILPTYAIEGAACLDLAVHGEDWALNAKDCGVNIPPGWTCTFNTGLSFDVPEGYAMLIFSRSGHGFKHDVSLSNCVGVIDPGYIGEVAVKLRNDGPHSFHVRAGDRIAQAMLVPVPRIELELVEEMGATARGAGGFGSTGR